MIAGKSSASIAASVEQAIRAGELAPGQNLPAIRELATRLAVSPVTVAAAYRELCARGLTSGEGRRGTRVRTRPGVEAARDHAVDVGPLRDLASGAPDPELLPPAATMPAPLADAHRPRLSGLPALQQFIRAELDADGIAGGLPLILSGGLDAIDRILRERLRPGDRIAVEDPGFPPLFELIAVSGFQVEPVGLDDNGPQPESVASALRRKVRAIVLTSRAQNPTGAIVAPSRAAALKPILAAHPDVLVIEIDPAGPLCADPAGTLCDGAHPSWAAVRPLGKFLGPDLRLAAVVGDDLTMARVRARHAAGPGWVSHHLQRLAVNAWSDPAGGRAIARAAEVYARRRIALIEALKECGIDARGRSGWNVWVPVPNEEIAVQSLAARGWLVTPGQRFRIRSASAIRITTSALEPDAARRFADDLAWVLRLAHAL